MLDPDAFHDLVRYSSDVITILAADGTIEYQSPSAERVLGYTPTDLVGENAFEYVHPEDRLAVAETFADAVGDADSRPEVEYRFRHADGDWVWLESLGSNHLTDPNIGGFVVNSRDVTERVLGERALERERERFELLVEGVEEYAVFLVDPEGRVSSWNAGAERIKGYAESDILGEHVSVFYTAEDVERGHPDALLEAAAAKGHVEERGWRVRRDGSRFYASVSVTALYNDDGEVRGYAKITRDLTDQLDYEETLRTLRTTTRSLMYARSPTDVAEILVETARRALGQPIAGCWLYDRGDDELRPAAWTDDAETLVGVPLTYRRDDGHPSWSVYESNEPVVHANFDDLPPDAPVVTSPMESEIALPLGPFGLLKIGATERDAFDDRDVELARILASDGEAAIEMAHHRATIERQRRRLDDFAKVVSHDLRNPLAVASGHADMLHGEVGESPHIEAIDRAHERMGQIVEDVLALAREGRTIADLAPVDLATVAATAWENVPDGPTALRIEAQGEILADRSRLIELLENLFRNAIEHGRQADGGTTDEPTMTVTVSTTADGFSVEDDGPGIPPSERDRVFEPGYSTANHGTGFGLAIVRAIANAHGWNATVETGSDGGARFVFSGVEAA